MADHKIAPRLQGIVKLIDDPVLCRHIKVNHYVSAEDAMKRLLKLKRIQQIEITVCNTFSQGIGHHKPLVVISGKVFLDPAVRNLAQLFSCIDPAFGDIQYLVGNIRS